MSPVEQAVGSHAYFWLQLAGYLVFAAAWLLISLAVMRGLVDLTSAIARHGAARSSSLKVARGSEYKDAEAAGSSIAIVGAFGRVDRLSPHPAIPPDASPCPVMSARVLTFEPRTTRNRLVVR